MFTMSGAFFVTVPIAWMFLVQGKDEELFYLVLVGTCALSVNGRIMPRTFLMMSSQKVLLMSVAAFLSIQVFGRRQSQMLTPMLLIVPYLLYMVLVSQKGWSPAISNLKLLLFLTVYFALYGAAAKVTSNRQDIRKLRSMMLAIAIFFIFGSVLIYPFKGYSMMGGEELLLNPDLKSMFKGMTFHSQTLGPVCAFLSTLLFADLVFSIQKKDKLYIALLLICPVLIYATASRTAMASYLIGMAGVIYFAMGNRLMKRGWRSKVVSGATGLAVCMIVGFLLVPTLRDKAVGFVVKYHEGKGALTTENILSSRQHKLDGAMANWRRSPYIGNGFQVSEDMKYIHINGIKDMLSAPVEKSTWCYAVLEEGGVIGMMIFAIFVIFTPILLIRKKAYVGVLLLIEILVSNLGEFSMFSMSGTGGMFWCLVFVGLALDHKRIHSRAPVWRTGPDVQMQGWMR